MAVLAIQRFAIRRLLLYYRNIRVQDWRAYLGMAVLGYIFGLDESSLLSSNPLILIPYVVSCTLFIAFSFSINNCFDVDCDSKQPSKLTKNPVAAGRITFREGVTVSSCIALAGLAVSYTAFSLTSFLLYASLSFWGASYSIPPMRLKARPLVDVVSHALGFGSLLFLYGVSVGGEFSFTSTIVAASLFTCSAIFELRNHLEDYEVDLASGLRTTTCWLGRQKTVVLLKALYLTHLALLALVLYLSHPSLQLISSVTLIFIFSTLLRRFGSLIKAIDRLSAFVYATAATSHLLWLIAGG